MTDKLKELIKRAETWPEEAQKEAIQALQDIEEDLVIDAADLEVAREQMKRGQGRPQEEVFRDLGL